MAVTKKYSFLQLFSIIDGRLSTTMDDIYDMLNHICDTELMTHHLPVALKYIKEKNPKWFQEQKERIAAIYITVPHLRLEHNDVDGQKKAKFEQIISEIKHKYNEDVEVPQLKDEFDTSDFEKYMVDNSLLIKKFK